MDPKVLKMMQGASGASDGKWEILAFTSKPKKAQTFSSYTDWSTGYEDELWWTGNATSPLEGGSWNTAAYPCDRFGRIGRGEFQTHTESNSGADTRTAAMDGDGFYSAAYNKTGLTKIALVGADASGNSFDNLGNATTLDLTDPTNSTHHLVYDLVGTSGNTDDADAGTGTYTLISLLQTLSAYNRNNTNWASQGTNNAHNLLFNGPNCRNFTSGGGAKTEAGYSGILSSAAGQMRNISTLADPTRSTIDTTHYPRFFCFWGINLDSDHDTQVCCAYGSGSSSGYNAIGRADNMGSLATQSVALKKDNWRGAGPLWSFWSLWGNDWHSDSQKQNISGASNQTGSSASTSDYAGSNMTISGTAYTFSNQSWPGTATPDAGVAQDPTAHMTKAVYLLGFS
tara:strand:- start:74 stop:1267 length:1194 start_codon:yes stop_codon:yes gene_type:complete